MKPESFGFEDIVSGYQSTQVTVIVTGKSDRSPDFPFAA
jgi:hypothetical protein